MISKERVNEFIKRFFSEPNGIHYTMLREGTPESVLRPWCMRLRKEPLDWTVLPVRTTDGHKTWYAIAFSDRDFRLLRDYLEAFVGPTYSDFNRLRAHLDPASPQEKALSELTTRCFRFQLHGKGFKRLQNMLAVLDQRREVQADSVSTGRLLRNFEMAIEASNRDGAEGLLGQLRREHRVDAKNLQYLQIRMLAGLGRWDDLTKLPELPDLLRVPRPSAVTEAVLQAVYRTDLEQFEETLDAEGAVKAFRNLRAAWPPLFQSRLGMRSPEATLAFMLCAVTSRPPDDALRAALVEDPTLVGKRRAFLEAIAALAPPPSPPPSTSLAEQARAAALAGDCDRLFELASDLPPDADRCRLFLECALAFPCARTERAFLEAHEALTEVERDKLSSDPRGEEVLQRYAPEQVVEDPIEEPTVLLVDPIPIEVVPPSHWSAWLERLNAEGNFPGVVRLANLGATEWTVSDLLAFEREPDRLNALLGMRRSDEAEVVLGRCLPYMVRTFTSDPGWPRPILTETYRTMLVCLSLLRGSGDTFAVYGDMLSGVLDLALSDEEYRDAVDSLSAMLENLGAPSTLDQALDALEVLALHRCHDDKVRNASCENVTTLFAKYANRVHSYQYEILNQLRKEMGLSPVQFTLPRANANAATASPFSWLKDRTLTIYTLAESAAARVQHFLEAHVANVRIRLLHDKVASTRLKEYARTSDYFVVATDSAKHAATNEIRAQRPPQKPLQYAAGKGSSSLLQAIATMTCPR